MITTPVRTRRVFLAAVAATPSSSPLVGTSLSRHKGPGHHPKGCLGAPPIPRTRDVLRQGPPMLVRNVHCGSRTSPVGPPRPGRTACHRGAASPAPEPPRAARAVVGGRLLG